MYWCNYTIEVYIGFGLLVIEYRKSSDGDGSFQCVGVKN